MKKSVLIKRKQIDSIMSLIYDYPLTIVEAPMGFGKTSAVRGFLKADKNSPLWIAFMREGEPVSLFWEKFSAEIGKLDEVISAKLKSLGFPADIPQTEKVISLLNDITFIKKTVLVIDDFHLSPDMSINNFLMRIINERIDNLHIVIITRDTTYIDFTELLSKGLCHIISQQKLKFTEDEVHEYCRIMADVISEADIKKISEYTDGWISLVYLALLGLESNIPVGMNASIDELVEKVLFNKYDEHIKDFLLKLSLMDDFSAGQACYVIREEKTAELLKRLRKENAFVYYDQASQTYRIHNVLLDFLRMKRHFSNEELCDLYSRMGEWYLSQNNFLAAYSCLNRAGKVEKILSHLNEPDNIRNELTSFEGSFEMFSNAPYELLLKYPLAYLQHILLSIVRGDENTIANCAKQLDNLKKIYEKMDYIDEDYRNRILAEILIMKRFTSFNIIDPSSKDNNEILRLLNGKQSLIVSTQDEFTFGSPHLLYVYFRDKGTFKHISQLAIEKFSAFASFANGCGTGCEHLIPAEYALETGDFEAAELNSLRSIYKARTKQQTSIIICANFNLIRLYILQGKVSESLDMLRQLETDVAAVNNSIYNTTVDMCKGYIYACLEQYEKIPFWLQTGNMTSADLLYQGIAFNYIVYGKSVMLSNNYVALEILTDSLNDKFSMFSNQLGFIHNDIFKAVAKQHLYGMEDGVTELEKVLAKAQADNIIIPFVENAPHILDMLKIAANNDSKNEFIKRTVLLCEQYINVLNNSHQVRMRLSQREIEVLSLSAEGLSRDEIASRLSISQGTVRTHLAHIYQKLEVSGKVSAIKKAQMQGLI